MQYPRVIKVLDSTKGESETFFSVDNILNYKLVIKGLPDANIKAFYREPLKNTAFFYLKIYCEDWANSNVELQSQSAHEDDNWSDTGLIINKDVLLNLEELPYIITDNDNADLKKDGKTIQLRSLNILELILNEIKINNKHLEIITDQEIKESDL